MDRNKVPSWPQQKLTLTTFEIYFRSLIVKEWKKGSLTGKDATNNILKTLTKAEKELFWRRDVSSIFDGINKINRFRCIWKRYGTYTF